MRGHPGRERGRGRRPRSSMRRQPQRRTRAEGASRGEVDHTMDREEAHAFARRIARKSRPGAGGIAGRRAKLAAKPQDAYLQVANRALARARGNDVGAAEASTVVADRRGARARRRASGLSLSFPELVWVHFLRQQEVAAGRVYEGDAETRYRQFQRTFQARYGEIVSAYWATSTASGVALTIRGRPSVLPDTIRLHWATDWATKDVPDVTAVLYRSEALAVRVSEVLRDTSKRIAMQWLFNVVSGTLAFSETASAGDEATRAAFVAKQDAELDKIERYYKNSAGRSGQILY